MWILETEDRRGKVIAQSRSRDSLTDGMLNRATAEADVAEGVVAIDEAEAVLTLAEETASSSSSSTAVPRASSTQACFKIRGPICLDFLSVRLFCTHYFLIGLCYRLTATSAEAHHEHFDMQPRATSNMCFYCLIISTTSAL